MKKPIRLLLWILAGTLNGALIGIPFGFASALFLVGCNVRGELMAFYGALAGALATGLIGAAVGARKGARGKDPRAALRGVLWGSGLLVLVAGIFLPAFHLVQGAGRRMLCQHHLQQIGYALQSHHDDKGTYPAGAVPNAAFPVEKRLSWIVAILPYTEQGAVSKVIDRDLPWDAEVNRPAVSIPLPWMVDMGNPSKAAPNTPALAHYIGIAGIGVDAPLLPVGHPKAGFFGYERTVTMKDIKDGTSNTITVTETTSANGPWAAGGPSTVRGLDPNDQPYIGWKRQFGGFHRHGTNVLFVDGSVQFLQESIRPQVFEALATIAGGDKADDDF
jgi:prepilin-type processing-associated H-X9-DG protein